MTSRVAIRRWLWPAIGVLVAGGALYLFYDAVRHYDADEILAALRGLSVADLLVATALGAACFVVLAFSERLALAYAGHRLPFRRAAVTAFAAVGIGHGIGFGPLSSGAVRLRMYGRTGMGLPALGRMLAFLGVTVTMGLAVMAGLALLAQPALVRDTLGWNATEVRAAAVVPLLLPASYLLLCALRKEAFRLGPVTLSPPPLRLAGWQVVLGAAYYALVAATLTACLRPFAAVRYPEVATLYVASDTAAMIGHVPGGWGVLEYVLLQALGTPALLAGLIVFRAVFYLAPLLMGAMVFLADEALARHGAAARR